MKIQLTRKEVETAIEFWMRRQMDLDLDIEIRETGNYLHPYEVETDPDQYLFKETKDETNIVRSNFEFKQPTICISEHVESSASGC